MANLENNVRMQCSAEEWTLRCELAALYRLLAHFRMTDLVDTHISASIPGTDRHFLINRYGVLFHEMRASDLVKIDLDGNVVQETLAGEAPPRINPAGFTIHSAVHSARHDIQCVIHTHTSAGIGVSAQEHGLLPISQHALRFYGKLAYHDYEGVALDLSERDRLIADLGPHFSMILRNHGLLATGTTIPKAFQEIHFLERACQAQISALAGGTPLRIPSEEICRRVAVQSEEEDTEEYARFYWDAALRLLQPCTTAYDS
jgi:ribulose-5-phosphate 4-epimerase/fuculose-1-phosphate aldolase